MAGKFKSNIKTRDQKRQSYRGGKGNMKKTTKKGAYAISKKKVMSTRLNPIRETKKWKDSDLALIVTTVKQHHSEYGEFVDPRTAQDVTLSCANMSPQCQNFGFQGLGSTEMVGNSRYVRFLSQKVRFTFPQGVNIPVVPQEAYLIHGFITQPLNISSIATAGVQPEAVIPSYMSTYITEQVREFFNERNDELDWVPKGRSNLKILGKKLIRPRVNNRSWSAASQAMISSNGTPNASAVVPESPVYNISWPMKRKQQLYEGPTLPTDAAGYPNLNPHPMFFERGLWIPFSVIYQPQFDAQYPASDGRLKVSYDSIVYYSDM